MKEILTIWSIFLITNSTWAQEASSILTDFETDGCTMFIEGPSSSPNLWSHCCFEHDLRYWFGGTKENKNFADLQLRACVKDVAGNFWANVIYSGVRMGSFSPVKFKYVWGWAWDPKKTYSELTMSEIDYVIHRLNDVDIDSKYREDFINKYLKN